jgi:hypothetical protein
VVRTPRGDLKAGEIYTLPVSLAVDPFNLKRPTLDVQFSSGKARRRTTARDLAPTEQVYQQVVTARRTAMHGNGRQW